jgi:hypothetical protein
VRGSTAADMLANALFHTGHVRAELLRTYYEPRNSGDRPSVLRALSELRQHSRDEIALLERAGALEALAPPTTDKQPGEPPLAYTIASMHLPITDARHRGVRRARPEGPSCTWRH